MVATLAFATKMVHDHFVHSRVACQTQFKPTPTKIRKSGDHYTNRETDVHPVNLSTVSVISVFAPTMVKMHSARSKGVPFNNESFASLRKKKSLT